MTAHSNALWLVLTIFCSLTIAADGITCTKGLSALCGLATIENNQLGSVMQNLRDAIYASNKPDSTTYKAGEHITCISNHVSIVVGAGRIVSLGVNINIGTGGICVFPEKTTEPMTLGTIKKLADSLVSKGCTTCGLSPAHYVDQGVNDITKGGYLKFDYVGNPACVGQCISYTAGSGSGSGSGSAGTVTVVAAPAPVTKISTQTAVTMAAPVTSVISTKTATAVTTVQAVQSVQTVAPIQITQAALTVTSTQAVQSAQTPTTVQAVQSAQTITSTVLATSASTASASTQARSGGNSALSQGPGGLSYMTIVCCAMAALALCML